MKLIIKDINYKNKTFYCYLDGRKTGFYLTNSLSKIFFDSLKKGILIDIDISDRKKKIEGRLYHQVLHFNKITNLSNKFVVYDHELLKKNMIQFLKEKEYFLFLDLEMTIPFPRQKGFIPEIVQYGLYLTNNKNEIIFEDGSYILTSLQNPISRRTFKFLSIDNNKYYNEAKTYNHFYEVLKKLIDKYDPKIVVWGKNDIIAINHSYDIYNVNKLTNKNNFIDLLKLHKDYFNLKNDLGLFKAYETYYEKSFEQVHDAKDDAKVTKKVFEAFLNYSMEDTKDI